MTKTAKQKKWKKPKLESLVLKRRYYSRGRYIYKRFHHALSLREMRVNEQPQWFALTDSYGEGSYGSLVQTYKIRKNLRLINVGSNAVRSRLHKIAEEGEGRSLSKLFNPDEQWSGGTGNRDFHGMMQKYFGFKYHGTIVVEDSPVTSDENQGATEVVLWSGYDSLQLC